MVAIDFKSLIRQERHRRGARKDSTADFLSGAAGTWALGGRERRSQCACCRDRPAQACRLQEQQPQEHLRSDLLDAKAESQPVLEWPRWSVGPLQSLYYVPDFLSAEEEAQILQCIDAAPTNRWIDAGGRRMQNWGGRPGEATVREELPLFIQALVRMLVAAGAYTGDTAPNHCLINDYHGGEGIPAHRDGPLYLSTVATISLGGPALISFHKADEDGLQGNLATQVMLQPRCLLVVSGDAYTNHLHSIASQRADEVTEHCCNAAAAGVAQGEAVPRAPRRVSLVFVRKLGATSS